uniref:Uncharacterized protein n=1 Tax=Triticum urartu TaxID=4572 RepID=A0A8R7QYZ7_TRIUA
MSRASMPAPSSTSTRQSITPMPVVAGHTLMQPCTPPLPYDTPIE